MAIHHLKTDVVIMGGGLAGLNGAIAAAERGTHVVVMALKFADHGFS